MANLSSSLPVSSFQLLGRQQMQEQNSETKKKCVVDPLVHTQSIKRNKIKWNKIKIKKKEKYICNREKASQSNTEIQSSGPIPSYFSKILNTLFRETLKTETSAANQQKNSKNRYILLVSIWVFPPHVSSFNLLVGLLCSFVQMVYFKLLGVTVILQIKFDLG